MKRWVYDLSCYNVVSGLIGRLQTIFNLPVIANDTISIDLVGALRLSRLKRFLVLDCKVDLFAFFSPHRHHYTNWTDLMKDGINSAETLATSNQNQGTAAATPPDFLGSVPNGTIPAHYPSGYQDIYNNFFQIPSLEGYSLPTYSISNVANDRAYGFVTARLPAFWTTGMDDTRADIASDAEVGASAGAGAINLLDFRRIQAEYKDAIDHSWWSARYRDVMQRKWGTASPPSTDADQRPTLLMHESTWLSGYDVDGTDDAQLGNWRGKSQGMVRLKMPPKYFNEHGMIWVMAVLRFPSILQEEVHYTAANTLSYDNFLADPKVLDSTPPISIDQDDLTGNGVATTLGTHPYGQWFRTQPNRVHTDFHGPEGYPFETIDNISNHDDAAYYDWLDPNDFFMNEDLGQWNIVSRANIEAKRVVPPAIGSINTGTVLH